MNRTLVSLILFMLLADAVLISPVGVAFIGHHPWAMIVLLIQLAATIGLLLALHVRETRTGPIPRHIPSDEE